MSGDGRTHISIDGGAITGGVEGDGDSESRLRLVLDAVGLGAWTIDLASGTVACSPHCRELIGLPVEEEATIDGLLARTHAEDRPRLRAVVERALDPAGAGQLVIDHRVVHHDGVVGWVRVRGRAAFAGEGRDRRATSCSGIVQDVSDEIQALDDGRFVLSLGAGLLTIQDPEGVLLVALTRLREHLDVSQALALEIDAEGSQLRILAHVARREGVSQVGELDLAALASPEWFADVARGRVIALDDTQCDTTVASDSHAAPWSAPAGAPFAFRSSVTIPQARGGRFVGALSVADEVPRQWTEREIEIVRQVAERAWPVYESARLLRAEQRAVAERDRLLAVVRESEAAFRAAFDHASVGMMQIASDGEILRANAYLASWLGYQLSELVGRNVLELSHPADRADEHAMLSQLFRGEIARYEREKRYVRRDGSAVWGVLSGTLVRADTGVPLYCLAAVNDVTARREAEERVAFAARRVERLQLVTAQLSRAATVGEVCETLVTVGREALGADAGLIVLVDEVPGMLRVERAFRYSSHLLDRWRRIPLTTAVPVAEAVRTRTPVWLGSRRAGATRFPVLADDLGEHEHHAWAALPLIVESRAVGAIGVSFHEPREFPDEFRTFALALAQQCAQALERARLYEAERRARAEAEEARQRAETANRTKSDFLAVMSHELRTPLNAIGGYAQLLAMGIRGPVTAQQQEDLARIERSQRALLGLINDVLSFAKLESGRLDYVITRVPVEDLLGGLEALVRPQLEERHLHYRYEPPLPGIAVRADRDRALQILLNLLTNAVKFTPADGTISVWADALPADVAIRVRDTGPGIPPQKLELIFEPFVQVDTRLTRQSSGIGLGLAISRDLARAMGGEVLVESAEGEGATFTVVLPRS